jgi:hypothetical protein
MTPRMVTITVDQNTALALQKLQAKADAQNVTLEYLLLPLLENGDAAPDARPLYETATAAELAQAYLDWATSHDRNTPGLTPEDLRREHIYEDRW